MRIIELKKFEPSGQWDQNFLDLLFGNKVFDTGYVFEEDENLSESNGVVAFIPGQYYAGKEKKIEEQLSQYEWVLAIKTSDEENLFDWAAVEHPKIKWWIQTPRTDIDYGDARLFGVGYTPHFNEISNKDFASTQLDMFLSAQDTHERRHEAFNMVERLRLVKVIERTGGFTQGMEKEQYRKSMVSSKIAPAPSGVFSPDSFRVYEALESHTIPIADDVSPAYESAGYWNKLYPDAPFPIISDYNDLPQYCEEILRHYTPLNNRITEWWIQKKREMVDWIISDVSELSGCQPEFKESITVVIPVSPIKSHPDTFILEETIKSVRHHLPNSEIILMFDGVREEQENRRIDYEDFIQTMLWKANHVYKNIVPVIFDEHMHQTGMTRAILDYIKTPLLLFVEQDTPLVSDETIEWDVCVENIITTGVADVIRFHHEGVIPKEHEHMIHGYIPNSNIFLRTSQWSQRPHLSTVAFYRRILTTCFSENAKSFIEDKMHGVAAEAYNIDGLQGWQNYRLVIYAPKGSDNIKRSYHTNGRDGEEKYDESQVF